MTIKIIRLYRIEASGDWHDAPLKWQVEGPNAEVQKFSTKALAQAYAKIRRNAATSNEAHRAFANYSPVAVNRAIEQSNRAGRKIGGREARAIHALLAGRH